MPTPWLPAPLAPAPPRQPPARRGSQHARQRRAPGSPDRGAPHRLGTAGVAGVGSRPRHCAGQSVCLRCGRALASRGLGLRDALAFVLVLSHVARRTGFLSFLLADRPCAGTACTGSSGWPRCRTQQLPFYTAYFRPADHRRHPRARVLEWHWPARRGSRALQFSSSSMGCRRRRSLFYFIRPEWVTPFASGGGSEPRSHHRWRVCRLRQLGSAVRLVSSSRSRSSPKSRPPPSWRSCLYLACWWLIVLSQHGRRWRGRRLSADHAPRESPGALRRPSSGSVRRLPSSVCGSPGARGSCPRRPGAARTRDPVRPHRGFCVPSRSLAGITAVGLQGSPLGRGTCCSTSCNADT